MTAALWLGSLTLLPVAAFALAAARRGRMWHTRTVPADAFRLLTGAIFAAWVDPSLGVLAGLSAFWWAWHGWPRLAGGTLWPLVAMGLYLGLHAPAWAMDGALAALLTMGVVQTVVGLLQRLGFPIFRSGSQIHGTFGHRTGFGIYLATLIPLAFLTDYSWPLTFLFAIGVVMSMSSVAAGAAAAGLLIVAPWLWPGAVAVALVAAWPRVFKWRPADSRWGFRLRHMGDTLTNRRRIWRATVSRTTRWPTWLVGRGAMAFAEDARGWMQNEGIAAGGEVFQEAHNDYLEALYEYGLVGALAFGWWLWRFGVFSPESPLTGAMAAFGVAMLANFPARVAPLAAVALLVAVLLMRGGA